MNLDLRTLFDLFNYCEHSFFIGKLQLVISSCSEILNLTAQLCQIKGVFMIIKVKL
jgi:hypothetical protein